MSLVLFIAILIVIFIAPRTRGLGFSLRLRSRPGSQIGLSAAILLVALRAYSDTILASKHDLSASGPGTIRASAESEVCLFCHTPHRSTGETPLWNHTLSQAIYIPYSSSTAKATIGQPTGSSKLCLSCHDGTVALGMVNTRTMPIDMRSGISTMPAGRSNLGMDLADDHPVSFVYDNTLMSASGQLRDPSLLMGKVRLDYTHQMQCTSCHDPHNDQYGKFLVQDSALCVACHNMDFWQDSIHRTSNKSWNGNEVNPWPHTTLKTVAANACENCHTPHGAGGKARLLNFANGPDNCFSCHNGNVAASNIQREFNKFSTHPLLNGSRPHDPV